MKWVMQLPDLLADPESSAPQSDPVPRRKRRPRIVPKRRIRRRWPTPAEMARAARKAARAKLKARKRRKRRPRTREEREAALYAGRRYEDVSHAALDRDFRDERLERRHIVNIAALGDPPPGRWRPNMSEK
jgi:hypothetical protein